MPDLADALLEDGHGTIIALEVSAHAKTSAFPAGYNEWRKTIGCRVTAPAVEGRANQAVLILVSDTLSVPASQLSIHSGATSPQKRVRVEGITKNDLLARLKKITGP